MTILNKYCMQIHYLGASAGKSDVSLDLVPSRCILITIRILLSDLVYSSNSGVIQPIYPENHFSYSKFNSYFYRTFKRLEELRLLNPVWDLQVIIILKIEFSNSFDDILECTFFCSVSCMFNWLFLCTTEVFLIIMLKSISVP